MDVVHETSRVCLRWLSRLREPAAVDNELVLDFLAPWKRNLGDEAIF